MLSTPNYVAIGDSEYKNGLLPELCDDCGRRVWIPRGTREMLEEAEYRDDRSAVYCVMHAMARYGQAITVQILVSQKEGEEK